MTDDFKKLNELIKGIGVAMMATIDDHGAIRSRPMMTQESEPSRELWFFTAEDSGKVDEVRKDARVNLSYASPKDNRYVSISGPAQLVRDSQKIHELWKPIYKAWFPQGVEDPRIALIKVTIEEAEYWDSPSGKMVQLFGLAKALLTGKAYAGEASSHGKLSKN